MLLIKNIATNKTLFSKILTTLNELINEKFLKMKKLHFLY